MLRWIVALVLLVLPFQAQAQNFIQIPACGNNLPPSIRPSAPTITMNPSGQVCIAGSFSATVPTPTVVIPSPLTITIYPSQVVSGAFADGALVTLGQVGEAAYKTVGASGDVIALLKGIFNNVITPISVSGNFSSTTTTVNINSITPTPLNVTVGNGNPNGQATKAGSSPVVLPSDQTPLNVTLAASPLNVTGSLTANVSSPIAVNIASSPVNVTGNFTTGTPLNVTLVASPLGVIVNNDNPNGQATMANSSPVVIASDQSAVLVTPTPSPISVAIASSPVNVTGSFSTTVSSPLGVNIASSPVNVTMASPLNVTGNLTANVSSPIGVNIASSPVQITLPASPISVGISSTPLNVTVGGIISPQNVTIGTSPVAVTIASSPVNVTGNFTSTATGTNVVQLAGQTLASPTTYGIATTGSVQNVNAFVTSLPATPLNVTVGNSPTVVLSGSPVSVGIAGPTPLNVTIAASPLNVTGNFSSTPTGSNIVQLAGQTLASPTTYGIATTGSVQNVNAFVTSLPATPLNVTVGNSPTVVLSGSPVSVGIAGPTPLNVTVGGIVSPLNVTLAGPTPLNMTLVAIPGTPISVAIASSPPNVTVGNPQTNGVNTDIVQLAGQALASPTTYGIATTGSVQNVNAFVTSLPATPLNVTIAQTPINVTLAPSPINVTVGGIASPQNVTLAGPTPLNVTVGNLASPQGVALSGIGATLTPQNVTVANGNPNGQAAMASSSPVVVASDNNVVMHLSLSRVASVIAHTVTTAFGVTNVALGLGVTPGVTPGFAGSHQLAQTWCQGRTAVATPPVFFLQIFNNTSTETTLGTTKPAVLIAISGTPVQVGSIPALLPPGMTLTAISFALTQGPLGSATAVGQTVDCTFVYN